MNAYAAQLADAIQSGTNAATARDRRDAWEQETAVKDAYWDAGSGTLDDLYAAAFAIIDALTSHPDEP